MVFRFLVLFELLTRWLLQIAGITVKDYFSAQDLCGNLWEVCQAYPTDSVGVTRSEVGFVHLGLGFRALPRPSRYCILEELC